MSTRHVVADRPVPRSSPSRAAWLLVSGSATALLMVVVYLWDTTAFLVDDKRDQYLPVAMDIGRRLTAGEWLPVIDPNLGISGNFAIDIQYGIFDPSHWLVAIALSRFSDLQLAAFLWSLAFELVLALGTTALGARLRMPGPWAAAAGLAAASGGWVFLKLAPDWMPGLVSLAWLPWLWWAWVGAGGRVRVRDCLGVAVFTYLVIAGGWPATWLAFGALMVGLGLESVVRREPTLGAWSWAEPLLVRWMASMAGLVAAALCLVPLLNAQAYTVRGGSIGNDNFLTGNLADMLAFAAPQLHGDILTFGGQTTLDLPVYFAVYFAVVVLWTTRWDAGLWRRPGFVTSLAGCLLMLLLTQVPSSMGALRDPIRQLGGAQLFFAVGICTVAAAGRWVVTRTRVLGVAATVAAMGWLSWARQPEGPGTLTGILVVAGAAAVLGLVVARLSRLAAVTALVTTLGLSVLTFGLYHGDPVPSAVRAPDRLTAGTLGLTPADEPVFAAYSSGDPAQWDRWQDDGVGRAFSDLRADGRIAPGYSSLGQRGFRQHFCIRVAQGNGCPDELDRLFATEPTTGRSWADLLGYRTILVQGPSRQLTMARLAPPGWRLVGSGSEFDAYRRSGAASVAGRVTDVIGQAAVRVTALSNQTQTYDVRTSGGARLVFRDLFWPGYVATLNGEQIPVGALRDTLLTVRLPPGSSGQLRVSYVPLPTKPFVVLPAASATLLAAAALWVVVRSRRRR